MAPAVERPMPGSASDLRERARKLPGVLLADAQRGAVQVARPRVVAQARPQVQHLIDAAPPARAFTSGKRAMKRW